MLFRPSDPVLAGETIVEDSRIRACSPLSSTALKSGASVVLASHLGRPQGMREPR
jgi:3-phosphoglycerate kinase